MSFLSGEPNKAAVWADVLEIDAADIASYVDGLTAGWSSYMEIAPFVSYTADMVIDCKGPGE